MRCVVASGFQVVSTQWPLRHQALPAHRAWGQPEGNAGDALHVTSQKQSQWQHQGDSNQNEESSISILYAAYAWEVADTLWLIMFNLIQEHRLDGASKTPSHHALAYRSTLGRCCLDPFGPGPNLTTTLAVADANTRRLCFAIGFATFLVLFWPKIIVYVSSYSRYLGRSILSDIVFINLYHLGYAWEQLIPESMTSFYW